MGISNYAYFFLRGYNINRILLSSHSRLSCELIVASLLGIFESQPLLSTHVVLLERYWYVHLYANENGRL